MKRFIGWTAIALFSLATTFVFTFSPLAQNLSFGNVLYLLLVALVITVVVGLNITGIVACCMLAKRLGYEQMNGLLLVIPLVNIFVFFYWAFKESPNERKLRKLNQSN